MSEEKKQNKAADKPEEKDCGAYFCCCFSADPSDKDPRTGRQGTWEVSMCDSFCKDPCCCLAGMILCCPTQCYMRHKILKAYGEWPEGYLCCQEQEPCCCCLDNKAMGSCCGALPSKSEPVACCCLFLESFLCFLCATQASRSYVMDRKQIAPDPCDNRLIAFSNCLQCLACLVEIAACIGSFFGAPDELGDAAFIITLVADGVLLAIMGCMTAQTNVEIKAGTDQKCGPPPTAVQMAR